MTDGTGGRLDLQLAGRRALVTGAGQGVGAGIARLLAEAGAEVVVNDLHAARAAQVVAAIGDAGGRADVAAFDVTDHAGVATAVAAIGPIDVLVNNAGNAGADGFGNLVRFVDSTPADWEAFIGVNLHGVLNCTHAVLPAMLDRGWGRIITVVSDSARSGGARLAVYGAAKAGAAGFSRGLALEVARRGVTVNNVAPATMRTEATEALWGDPAQEAQQDRILDGYPIRRPGDPDDVAWIVAALASPRADWVTGQTIPVNGGFSFTL